MTKHIEKPSQQEIADYLAALNRSYAGYCRDRKEATEAGYRAARQWFTSRRIVIVLTGGPNNPHWELDMGGSGQPVDQSEEAE